MSWDSNAPLHFKLGSVAMWHALTDRTTVRNNLTLQVLSNSFARMEGVCAGVRNEFEDMTSRTLPATFLARRAAEEAQERAISRERKRIVRRERRRIQYLIKMKYRSPYE